MSTTAPPGTTPTLHGWQSLTTIAEHLGLHRGTVYSTLMRALDMGQDWVKREEHPQRGRRRKWLMNTDSPLYQQHEQRWRRLQQKQQTRLDALTATQPAASATWDACWGDNPLERETADWYAVEDVHLWSAPPPLPPPPVALGQGQTPPFHRRPWWRTGAAPVLALQLITIACILITRSPHRRQDA